MTILNEHIKYIRRKAIYDWDICFKDCQEGKIDIEKLIHAITILNQIDGEILNSQINELEFKYKSLSIENSKIIKEKSLKEKAELGRLENRKYLEKINGKNTIL